jgi:hypothetical protein
MLRALALALLLSSLAAAGVHAQVPSPVVPPDVVQLANGGMVRGTIVENIPGDHVTIQIATGEVRMFSAGEVTYAGPTSAPQSIIPSPPMPPMAPPRRTVRVHVDAATDDLTLQRVTGTATAVVSSGRGYAQVQIDQFAPLCSAPCDLELEPGPYTLGVSLGQGGARRADHNLFTFSSDTSLSLIYESREGIRIAGWITFIVGGLTGAAIMIAPILSGSEDFVVPLIAGGAVLIVAEIVGLALAFLNDHADIEQTY